MTATQKEAQFYGREVQIQERNGDKTVYEIEGGGTLTVFKLFPGIEMIYNDLYITTWTHPSEPLPDIMEINHCRRGRFECEFRQGSYAYLGEGDLGVNMLSNNTICPRFPLGVYQGATAMIDFSIAKDRLPHLLKGVEIELEILREKLCPHNTCLVLKAPVKVQHIFEEIYTVDAEIETGYLRLKILELLLILTILPSPDPSEISPYFSADQVQKVKHIREHLMTSLDQDLTLKELATEHEISLTALKNCFKAIYGKTVYAYRREYRMQTAANMLRNTPLTILEIAGRVGYENPGKFAAAFKEIMGMTPGDYRKKVIGLLD